MMGFAMVYYYLYIGKSCQIHSTDLPFPLSLPSFHSPVYSTKLLFFFAPHPCFGLASTYLIKHLTFGFGDCHHLFSTIVSRKTTSGNKNNDSMILLQPTEKQYPKSVFSVISYPWTKHIDRKTGIYQHVKDPEEANGEAHVLRSFHL